jgi:hypothetical protein
MVKRQRLTAEFKREAVRLLNAGLRYGWIFLPRLQKPGSKNPKNPKNPGQSALSNVRFGRNRTLQPHRDPVSAPGFADRHSPLWFVSVSRPMSERSS